MTDDPSSSPANGPGAAAVLAAGIGFMVFGILALAGDAMASVSKVLTVWKPTGDLSGVSDAAIVVWLASWAGLARIWRSKTVNLNAINLASLSMVVVGLLLTFPPFMDLLQGK
jgi:hypothetical protein